MSRNQVEVSGKVQSALAILSLADSQIQDGVRLLLEARADGEITIGEASEVCNATQRIDCSKGMAVLLISNRLVGELPASQ